HRAPRHPELLGQVAGGRHPVAPCEPSVEDRLAQGGVDPGGPVARRVEAHVDVHVEIVDRTSRLREKRTCSAVQPRPEHGVMPPRTRPITAAAPPPGQPPGHSSAPVTHGTLTVAQGTALSVGAVLGTGVITLPALAAAAAGPASLVAWGALVLLSVP